MHNSKTTAVVRSDSATVVVLPLLLAVHKVDRAQQELKNEQWQWHSSTSCTEIAVIIRRFLLQGHPPVAKTTLD